MGIPFSGTNRLALDAAVDASITTAGGAVSLWNDIGTSGRDFAVGVPPDHNSTDDIVNFNGSNDYLIGSVGSLLPATGDWTLVVRFAFASGRSNMLITNYDHNTTPSLGAWAIYLTNTNVPRMYISYNPGVTVTATGAISPIGLHTITASRSGSTFSIRADGGVPTEVVGGSGSLYTGVARLGVAYARDYLQGGIQRIGVWGQALSGGDLDAVENWAANGSSVNISAIIHHRRMQGMS